MILFVHMLFSSAIGFLVNNIYLAIVLALLSHYFLDFIPHIDYNIFTNRKTAVIKVATDLLIGFFLIFWLASNQYIIYVYALAGIIPDALTFLSMIFPNKILMIHRHIHTQKIHFLKHKKISKFWRIFSQVLVVILSIIILRH